MAFHQFTEGSVAWLARGLWKSQVVGSNPTLLIIAMCQSVANTLVAEWFTRWF